MKRPLSCLPPKTLHENQLPERFVTSPAARGHSCPQQRTRWWGRGSAETSPFQIMSASRARLEALTKDLHIHWHETKESWSDAKAHEFEHKYLEELFTSVDRAVS